MEPSSSRRGLFFVIVFVFVFVFVFECVFSPRSVHGILIVKKRTGDVSRWRYILLFQCDRSPE